MNKKELLEHAYETFLAFYRDQTGIDFNKVPNRHDYESKIRWFVDQMFEIILHTFEQTINSQKVTKYLFVEDGSVDLDALQQRLEITNPETYIVTYRQGSQKPCLVEVK